MTHGIPDAERLQDLLDRMNSSLADVQQIDEKMRDLSFKRVAAFKKYRDDAREYETFKSALAGQKDGRYA